MKLSLLTDCKFGFCLDKEMTVCMHPYHTGRYRYLASLKKECNYTENMRQCKYFEKQEYTYGNEYGQQKKRG